MALCRFFALFLIHVYLLVSLCLADDPFVSYDFEVSYITASPLGVPQQVSSLDLFVFAFSCYILSTSSSGSFSVSSWFSFLRNGSALLSQKFQSLASDLLSLFGP